MEVFKICILAYSRLLLNVLLWFTLSLLSKTNIVEFVVCLFVLNPAVQHIQMSCTTVHVYGLRLRALEHDEL